jgi:hypothetical protein
MLKKKLIKPPTTNLKYTTGIATYKFTTIIMRITISQWTE